MFFFSNFCLDVSIALINDWVEFAELGKLDSAVCNHKNRKEYLELLSNEFVFVENNCRCENEESLNWIAVRQIKLRTLCCSPRNHVIAGDKLFSGITKFISSLNIDCNNVNHKFEFVLYNLIN